MNQTTLKYGEKEKVVVVSKKEKAIQELPVLVDQAGFQVTSHDLVLLKPNVCGMYPPALELLRAVIQYIKPHSKTIIIGETPSMGHSPNERFESLGIKSLARQLGVAVRDLMEDEAVMKRVPKPHAMKEIPLPSTVLEADLLVNVPGLGTHGNTLLTCALKNLFGLIAVRRKYSRLHPKGVSKVVADVYQLVKPQLNVVDCGHQVLVGTDALSVDVVACEFKSLSPSRVRHLVLAAQELGVELSDLRIRRIEL
jgi:uncharacterized protein (DUF362 family)